MRDERTNSSAPSQPPASKRCSGCGRVKPTSDFYRYRGGKRSSRCKACQCAAARTTSRDRRGALRALIAAHHEEYRSLLAAERAKRGHRGEPTSGGGADVA
jgi:recombinational DNA repair protein (RecF pathway)